MMCVVHQLSAVTALHFFSSPQTLLRELELSVVPKLEHKNLLPWFAIISGEKSERRPGQVLCYQIMQKMTGEYMVPVLCTMYVCTLKGFTLLAPHLHLHMSVVGKNSPS